MHTSVRPQSITCLGGHDKLPVWKEGNLLLPYFSSPRAKMVGQWWNQDIISEILKDNSLFYFLRKSKSSSLQNQGTLSKGNWSFYIFSLPQYGWSSERQECGLYYDWRRNSRELSLFVSTIFHSREQVNKLYMLQPREECCTMGAPLLEPEVNLLIIVHSTHRHRVFTMW